MGSSCAWWSLIRLYTLPMLVSFIGRAMYLKKYIKYFFPVFALGFFLFPNISHGEQIPSSVYYYIASSTNEVSGFRLNYEITRETVANATEFDAWCEALPNWYISRLDFSWKSGSGSGSSVYSGAIFVSGQSSLSLSNWKYLLATSTDTQTVDGSTSSFTDDSIYFDPAVSIRSGCLAMDTALMSFPHDVVLSVGLLQESGSRGLRSNADYYSYPAWSMLDSYLTTRSIDGQVYAETDYYTAQGWWNDTGTSTVPDILNSCNIFSDPASCIIQLISYFFSPNTGIITTYVSTSITQLRSTGIFALFGEVERVLSQFSLGFNSASTSVSTLVIPFGAEVNGFGSTSTIGVNLNTVGGFDILEDMRQFMEYVIYFLFAFAVISGIFLLVGRNKK